MLTVQRVQEYTHNVRAAVIENESMPSDSSDLGIQQCCLCRFRYYNRLSVDGECDEEEDDVS